METKAIKKTDNYEDWEEESDSKTYKLIMRTMKEMNFLSQRKREANEKDEQWKREARTERNYESGEACKKI